MIAFDAELVEVDGIDGVDGAAPAGVLVEADHGSRKADLRCAIEIVIGADEMDFHVRIETLPGEVGIDDEHGLAGGGPGGADGPGVGAGVGWGIGDSEFEGGASAGIEEGGDLGAHACHRAHVHVVDGAESVADDVDAGDGEDLAELRAEVSGVGLGVVVDATGEGVDVLAELRVLGVVPIAGAGGDSVGVKPAIEGELVFAPVFRAPATGFPVEADEEVALVLHLRVAVGVEHAFGGGGEDVRDAEFVPEDFIFGGGEEIGGEGEEDETAAHGFC